MMPLASFMTAARSFWFQKTCNQLHGIAIERGHLGMAGMPTALLEHEKEFVLVADLPGMKEDDFNIAVQ